LRFCSQREQKVTTASRESEYGNGVGTSGSAGNWAVDGGQNSENAQVVRALKSVDDLRAIKGIGPERIKKMRRYITVGSVAPKKPTSSGTAPSTARPSSHSPPKTASQNLPLSP
jgi:type II secretory pathway component PulK